MKKNLFFIFLFFTPLLWRGAAGMVQSQNLVPNGDFEYYNSCPASPNQVYLAFPWHDPNGATPDYFNACAIPSSYVSIPIQDPGSFQYTHSGSGYAGLFTLDGYGLNYREYIQVQLSDTLNNQKCYSVTFYASLYNILKIGTNNLGAYISQTAVTSIAPNPIVVIPQILLAGNPAIIDTLNWVEISGLYQASGGEKYITIGNFNYDSTTVTQISNSSSGLNNIAYYYIDDVSIYEIKTSNAGRDTTVCTGDSVQLGTNNYEGVTYSWQPTTGLSNANIGNPMASPSIATTYYLTQTTPCATTTDTVVVSVCTGIGVNEFGKDKYYKLYPNPNNGNFTLEYHLESNQSGSLTIYDVTGKQISSKNLNSSNTNVLIDATHLDAGVYYYEIKINGFKTKADKLIIIK